MLRNHAFRVRLMITVFGFLLVALCYYLFQAIGSLPYLSVIDSNLRLGTDCESCKKKVNPNHFDPPRSPTQELQYGVVIDAGSSGSRVFVYTWPQPTGNQGELLRVEHAYVDTSPTQRRRASLKVDSPLSATHSEPQNASLVMEPLLEFASRVIPEHLRRATPLFILATAGMRKLAVETRDAILADLRVDIPLMRHQWNFQPEYVRVISGVEEGLFGWIAVNYALNRFDSRRFFMIDRFPEATGQKPLIGFNHPAMLPDGHILVGSEVYKCVPLRNGSRLCRPETVGCFDMGGSSMQIAFEFQSDQPTPSELRDSVLSVNLGSSDQDELHAYRVFTTTYSNYGSNDAFTNYSTTLLRRSSRAAQRALRQHASLPPNATIRGNIWKVEERRSNSSLASRNVSAASNPHPPTLVLSGVLAHSHQLVLEDPCRPPGYESDAHPLPPELASELLTTYRVRGAGNFSHCVQWITRRLVDIRCVENAPAWAEQCSLGGSALPLVDRRFMNFYGFSEFFYTSYDLLNLSGQYNEKEFAKRSTEYCATSYSESLAKIRSRKFNNNDNEARILNQCFKSAWLYATIHHSFQFPSNYERLFNVRLIEGNDVQWTLGALLYHLRHLPLREIQRVALEKQRARAKRPASHSLTRLWPMNRSLWPELLLLSLVLVALVLSLLCLRPRHSSSSFAFYSNGASVPSASVSTTSCTPLWLRLALVRVRVALARCFRPRDPRSRTQSMLRPDEVPVRGLIPPVFSPLDTNKAYRLCLE